MKKKVVLLSLSVIALIAAIILIVLPADLNAAEGRWGHWIYDDQGNHIGCVSPGYDCEWNPQELM